MYLYLNAYRRPLPATVHSLQSTVHSPPSTLHSPRLRFILYRLRSTSTDYRSLPTLCDSLSTLYGSLPYTINSPPSPVNFPPSALHNLHLSSIVYHLQFTAPRPVYGITAYRRPSLSKAFRSSPASQRQLQGYHIQDPSVSTRHSSTPNRPQANPPAGAERGAYPHEVRRQ